MNPTIPDLLKTTRQLRVEGKIEESYTCARKHLGNHPAYRKLLWQHEPLFWRDVQEGCVMLTRRNAPDAAFIRSLWSNKEFIHSFHRLAGKLPDDQQELRNILGKEYVSLISDVNSIHWIVRDSKANPWGILSLTNISIAHERAEVLLGVLPGAPFGLATAAMLLLFKFFFQTMKFQKLFTLTYDDNEGSIAGVLHLGFQLEGRFRNHIKEPTTNQFVDLVQASLLSDEVFSPRNLRLAKRLLG